jgi:hypothetical protein
MTPVWTVMAIEITTLIGLLAFCVVFTIKAFRKLKANKNKEDVVGKPNDSQDCFGTPDECNCMEDSIEDVILPEDKGEDEQVK